MNELYFDGISSENNLWAFSNSPDNNICIFSAIDSKKNLQYVWLLDDEKDGCNLSDPIFYNIYVSDTVLGQVFYSASKFRKNLECAAKLWGYTLVYDTPSWDAQE